MPRIFLVRHGEPQAAWGGSVDDPGLSPKGVGQAEQAAAVLRARGECAAVSSPMLRCRETAAPYAANPVLDRRVSEIAAPLGAERRAWLEEHFSWRRPGRRRLWAECDPALLHWRDQVLAAVRGVEADTAVFTHFVAINVIVAAALRRDETIVCAPDHASITELTVEGGELSLIAMGAQMLQGDIR